MPERQLRRHVDEASLASLPSDEWTKRAERGFGGAPLSRAHDAAGRSKTGLLKNESNADEAFEDSEESTRQSWIPKMYVAQQSSSWGGYLSYLLPGRGKPLKSFTSGSDTRTDAPTADTRAAERSSHSRCYIENTESIQERRDDVDERCRQDHRNVDTMSSVEEISQISDITMDLRTILAESKFGGCEPLPTISEARRYVSPMSMHRESGQARTGKNDMIDFVFELMEENLCTPLNGSKAAEKKKKSFFNAVHDESINITKTNTNSLANNSIVQTSSSNRSRSNRTPRRSGKGSILPAPSNCTSSFAASAWSTKPALSGVKFSSSPAPPEQSPTREFVIVGKPPSPPPSVETNDNIGSSKRIISPEDEEQTLDWSKIMSFAERQLEGEDKSVMSKADSKISSRPSQSNRRSFFHDNNSTITDIKCNSTLNTFATATSKFDLPMADAKPDQTDQNRRVKSSTGSNSSSSHSTAVEALSSTDGSAAVQELRELSAMPMDSSSFEEEPRLLLTSLLLRLVRQLVPIFNRDGKSSRNAALTTSSLADEASESSHTPPVEPYGGEDIISDETITFRALRYVAFFLAFLLWPSGVPRRKIEYPPLPRKVEKPSLLKLVFEAPDEES
jgi:hypothetical protein